MQGTERYIDQRNEGVVCAGDDHVSREKVAKRYRILEFRLRGNFGGEKRVLFRPNSLFLPTKELSNGLRWGVSLSRRSVINLVEPKAWRATDLFEEQKGQEPGESSESCRDGAREKVRILLQKRTVTEHVGEPFSRM